jgi:hypothetical protein
MEIEAGGEFDQIELETGMGIRVMKVGGLLRKNDN